MNELITTTPKSPGEIIDRFCGHCGKSVLPQDSYCRNCGNACHDSDEIAELIPAQLLARSPNNAPAVVPSQGGITVQSVLNNRWAVIGIVALIGPLGLPAVWLCPRFSSRTKVLITAFYLLLTAVVPIVFVWWVLEDSFQPLVEAFGPLPAP